MVSILLSFNRAERAFLRGVLLPVVLVAFATLSMGAGAVFWAADRSNDISAERQLRTTEASIRAAVQELAQQQEMVAIWYDAVVELSKRSLDLK
jgi:sensor domain CHASE-containing protein